MHDEVDEDDVDGEQAEEQDGLVQVVELDEGRQGEDGHHPKVDQVLGRVFTVLG